MRIFRENWMWSKKGFTLIELLVVISIIALLTAIVLPNFMGARQKSGDSGKKQDLTAIKNALRLYYNDHQSYYPAPATGEPANSTLSVGLSSYMPGITGIGYTYYYSLADNGDGFYLWTEMEAETSDSVTESLKKCGVATTNVIGIGGSKVYVVCAR